MLEKVMELHFLLYAMMLMGGLGALGMLTTHLTYRRMIRNCLLYTSPSPRDA